jgi:hypothetical protein
MDDAVTAWEDDESLCRTTTMLIGLVTTTTLKISNTMNIKACTVAPLWPLQRFMAMTLRLTTEEVVMTTTAPPTGGTCLVLAPTEILMSTARNRIPTRAMKRPS